MEGDLHAINISPVFWSFVQTIIYADQHTDIHSNALYQWFQTMALCQKSVKIHTGYLFNVDHYDVNVPDGVSCHGEWLFFPDIPTMFLTIHQIYCYQEPSKHKHMIEACFQKIQEMVETNTKQEDLMVEIMHSLQNLHVK